MMKAKDLAAACVDIAKNRKTVYMWGVFGSPVSEGIITPKTNQYLSWYTTARQASFRTLIGKEYFGFDCVNLIKGVLWGWNGDLSAIYGGAKYASNGVPDVSADGAIKYCTDVSTDFSQLEVGEALWLPGHFGLYIGDGLAVECTTRWANGVQITAVSNMGSKSGYNARLWTRHGKMPWVEYSNDEIETEEDDMPVIYEKLGNVPTWYRPTIKKLMERKVLTGVSDPDPNSLEDNIINVDETYCRVMTTLDRLGKLD